MMAHVPLFAHKQPERVLIIGGGDGGVVREVIRHGKVSHVTLCDIDK
jgi:spermidine synthase